MTESFESIFRQHYAVVWRRAQWFGAPRDAVDDVVQDVFLTVAERLRDFRGDAKVSTWLYEITRFKVNDYLRRESRHQRRVNAYADVRGGERGADLHAQQEAMDLVCKALDQLDETRREVFVLAELEGMMHKEIAALVGVCENTVSSRLQAARQRFAAYVEQATAPAAMQTPTPCAGRRPGDVIPT